MVRPKSTKIKKRIVVWSLLILLHVILAGVWLWWVAAEKAGDMSAADNYNTPALKPETPASTGTGEPSGQTQKPGMAQGVTENPTPTEEALRVQEIAAGMTLHEKICQLFITYPAMLIEKDQAVPVRNVTEAGTELAKGLERWPVGGILWDKSSMENAEQLKKLLSDVQQMSRYPLIQTCDEEGGRVNRLMSSVGTTEIGPMMEYKDEGPETAFKNAETIATDLCAFGFNMDLAPVADVWSNPENEVIGDRAYSDNFEEVALLVSSAVKGFHKGGVAATLKHFPGHGDTSADSHYGAVYVKKTLEELRDAELLPFKAGVDAGADAVMVGHLIVSDVDSEPAPFSYTLVTEILREEMGFGGIVMTDSLRMKALTDYYTSGEIAVKAIKAGVDVLLCPENLEEAIDAIWAAIEQGEIGEERIDESVMRILELKLRYGIIK